MPNVGRTCASRRGGPKFVLPNGGCCLPEPGRGRAPPGAGARTISLFSAEKRETVLDSKEKRWG